MDQEARRVRLNLEATAATSTASGGDFTLEATANPEAAIATAAAAVPEVSGTSAATVASLIDDAVMYLSKTSSTYPAMAKRYGWDWRRWPQTSNWWRALDALDQAAAEAEGFH